MSQQENVIDLVSSAANKPIDVDQRERDSVRVKKPQPNALEGGGVFVSWNCPYTECGQRK